MIAKKSIAVLFVIVLSAPGVFAGSDFIPLQGMLSDDEGGPITNSVLMTFSMYDGLGATAAIWTESQSVFVENGFFTAYMGQVTELPSDLSDYNEIWLGLTVNSDPEMDRFLLGAVPFALGARHCEQVGGLTESDINKNFLPSSYKPAWDELTAVPQGFSDGVDDVGYDSESELTEALDDNYATANHDHDANYSLSTHNHNANYAAMVHNHNGIYSPAAHAHDENYAASSHNHNTNYAPIGSGVPTGAVMAFDLEDCPTGWSKLQKASGRVVVGMPDGGTLNETPNIDPLGNLEIRKESHSHGLQGDTGTSGAHNHKWYDRMKSFDANGNQMDLSRDEDGYGGGESTLHTELTHYTNNSSGHTHSINAGQATPYEVTTTMPYVQLLYCKKD